MINLTSNIDFQKQGDMGILTILNQSQLKQNLRLNFFVALHRILEKIQTEPINVLLITSEDPNSFSKGMSYDYLNSFCKKRDVHSRLNTIYNALSYLQKLTIPTISCIKGSCEGTAFELALNSTYRFSNDSINTTFSLPELNHGLFPLIGSAQWFFQRFENKYLHIMSQFCEPLPASAARKLGIIDEVIPDYLFDQTIQQLAFEIIRTGSYEGRQGYRDFVPTLIPRPHRPPLPIQEYKPAVEHLKKKEYSEFKQAHIDVTVELIQRQSKWRGLKYSSQVDQLKRKSEDQFISYPNLQLKIGFMGDVTPYTEFLVSLLSLGCAIRVFSPKAPTRKEISNHHLLQFKRGKSTSVKYRYSAIDDLELFAKMDFSIVTSINEESFQFLLENPPQRPLIFFDSPELNFDYVTKLKEQVDNLFILNLTPPLLGFRVAHLTEISGMQNSYELELLNQLLLSLKCVPIIRQSSLPRIEDTLQLSLQNGAFYLLDHGYSPLEIEKSCLSFGFKEGPFQGINNEKKRTLSLLDLHHIKTSHPLLHEFLYGNITLNNTPPWLSRLLMPFTERAKSLQNTALNQNNFLTSLPYEKYCGRQLEQNIRKSSYSPLQVIISFIVKEAYLFLNRQQSGEIKDLKNLLDILSVNHLGFPASQVGIISYYEKQQSFSYQEVLQ